MHVWENCVALSLVSFMALTAAATKGTFKERLSLNNPVVVGISPNRPNIFLSLAPPMKLPCFAESIGDQLKKRRLTFPKTVIFCQNYEDCARLLYTL